MPTKYRVEIASAAEDDLEEIWIHIASDSIETASRFVLELEDHAGALERFSLRCPLIPENEILGTEYRHLILGHYRVIFRVAMSTVYVLRIVHGNRLVDSSFFGEGKFDVDPEGFAWPDR